MAEFDYSKILVQKYSKPSVNTWNRLESSPRQTNFHRGLKAEIHDAMWMLTRQWQFGEFQGEDAGSPVSARVTGFHRTPDTFILSENQSFPYNADIPLEAMVEREVVQPILFLRVQMGRMWRKLLKSAEISQAYPFFLAAFPLPDYSNDDEEKSRNFYSLASGKIVDGYALYQKIQDDLPGFIDLLEDSELEISIKNQINPGVIRTFKEWYERLFFQPTDENSAWQPERMEYEFKLDIDKNNGNETFLKADDYVGGRLEWKDFDFVHNIEDRNDTGEFSSGTQKTDVFLPSMVTFKGMPHPRFWQMEEGNLDFGKIEKSPAGLVGLLLAEYGLTYSNDWFLLPYKQKINSLCSVEGIVVTDVFGHRHFVGPSRTTTDTDWHNFALFHLTQNGNQIADNQIFYLPPVVGAKIESPPIERVFFMRDEMANLVWAIEDIVPSECSGGKKVLVGERINEPDNEEESNEEAWKYTLGTTVPKNWIPFIAVHKKDSQSEIRLQRARMPNAQNPQSQLLQEIQPVHFVEENEVPRSGVIIERTIHRTRWLDGRTYCWVGRQKRTGRGEGSSELVFDRLED